MKVIDRTKAVTQKSFKKLFLKQKKRKKRKNPKNAKK